MTGATRTKPTFCVHAIPADVVADLLIRDDAGRPPRRLVDPDGGTPLRCCLARSRPGDAVALLSFAPLRRWARASGVDAGAYDEVGPVFVHGSRCDGYARTGYPGELRDSPRTLRAYRHDATIASGVVVPADGEFERALDELLADPQVAFVHARAVEFGCFTFAVHRAGGAVPH